MTEEIKTPDRPSAKNTFRDEKTAVCSICGCSCPPVAEMDCRKCNIPIAIGLLEVRNAVREVGERQ